MNTRDIIEPLRNFVTLEKPIVQALLSKVFKDDFVASDRVITWLYSAVFTATIAIRFNVALVATNALPKNVMRREVHLTFKAFLERSEIFNEVNSAI